MSNWIEQLKSGVERRKSREKAIESQLPEFFENLVKEIEQSISTINSEIYKDAGGLQLIRNGNYSYSVLNAAGTIESEVFFDFNDLRLNSGGFNFETNLDEVEGLRFTEPHMRGAGNAKLSQIAKLLIEQIVKKEFNLL